MRIVKPEVVVLTPLSLEMLKRIELYGRVCYKSESKITEGSAENFILSLVKRGHESVLEHVAITVKFVCDRGVSHELVRHRIASFSQESTRYVYSAELKEFRVITEEDVLSRYTTGKSMKWISEKSKGKYTEWEVYKILGKHGVESRSRNSSGTVTHAYFDVVDSVEKAYLLGLIQADGSVRGKGTPQVSITQHKQYSWYVQRMVRDFIKPTAKRSVDGDCNQVSVVSRRLVKALIKKGIVPNKSTKMSRKNARDLWSSIPVGFKASFLKGFLDGDGSVRFFTQKNEGETDSCNVCWYGNKHLLEFVCVWVREQFGYRAVVSKVSGAVGLFKVAVTQPSVGELVCKRLLQGFKFPYGHPEKTSRMLARVGGSYETASWGDDKFKVVLPAWYSYPVSADYWVWLEAMDCAEDCYAKLLETQSPQMARSVLPNSLKTEVVVTANLREWRHIFKLRCSSKAHPQMRQLMVPLWHYINKRLPSVFSDIEIGAEDMNWARVSEL